MFSNTVSCTCGVGLNSGLCFWRYCGGEWWRKVHSFLAKWSQHPAWQWRWNQSPHALCWIASRSDSQTIQSCLMSEFWGLRILCLISDSEACWCCVWCQTLRPAGVVSDVSQTLRPDVVFDVRLWGLLMLCLMSDSEAWCGVLCQTLRPDVYDVRLRSLMLCLMSDFEAWCCAWCQTLKPDVVSYVGLWGLMLCLMSGSEACWEAFLFYIYIFLKNQHTRELIIVRKTSHKHNTKDLSRLR